MPIRLVVKSKAQTGDQAPRELVLDADKVVVGRDAVCQVVLNEPVVSRRHLCIVREGALYFLEDLGSSFGTRVNNAALPAGEKRLLRNGDVIAIGPYDLTFDRIADAAAPGGAGEKTSYVAKRVVKDALRNLASGEGPQLRVMNGPLEGKRFELHQSRELVVGREAGVDIQLEDDLVSRRHAQFRRDWTGCHIEDLGSRNGVRVNRKRVDSQPLKDRDEVEIGSVRFLFLDPTEVRESPVVPEVPAPPPAAPAPAAPAAARKPSSVRSPAARGVAAGAAQPEPEAKPAPEPEPKPAAKPAPKPAPSPEPEEPEEKEEPETPEEPQEEESGSAEEPEEGDDDASEEEAEQKPAARGARRPSPLPGPRAAASEPAARPTWQDAVRNLVPILIVVGIAIFAVAILLVTFVVM